MNLAGASIIALFLAAVSACTVLPSQQQSIDEFRNRQKDAARQAEEDGHLLEALHLWQSLLPLANPDPEVGEAIASLEQRISARVAASLENGQAAYRMGEYRRGDTWMLRVLALEPGREEALAGLRRSASRRGRAQQAAKFRVDSELVRATRESPGAMVTPDNRLQLLFDKGEYGAVLAMAAREGGEPDDQTARLLRASHIALADRARKGRKSDRELFHLLSAMNSLPVANDPLQERSSELRATLSQEWYRRGNGLINADLPAAIVALEKSVAYDPDNHSARLKLKQARTLQRNLEKIQSR